jgi:phospholipid-transporting ATPase
MYKPQAYHHVQEIQKYNIQDYRPRYFHSFSFLHNTFANTRLAEWNSSKRQSEKCVKCNACANNAATPSRRQMSLRQECYKHMIPRKIVVGMVRWLVQDRLVGRTTSKYDTN